MSSKERRNERETDDEYAARTGASTGSRKAISDHYEAVMALPEGRAVIADILKVLGINSSLFVSGDTERTMQNVAGYENALALSKRLKQYAPELYQLMLKENQL